jgi:hypothetical protein
MKPNLILISIVFIHFITVSHAQKYMTRNGHIAFFSSTPIENIEAHNRQVGCVVDFATGEMIYQVLMKSFQFEKALMQEHFNENYVESHQYPKAVLKCKITKPSVVNLQKNGVYNITVSGNLTLHGVTKSISASGTIEVKDSKIHLKSKFNIKPKDYNIKIPSVMQSKIAETVQVTVDLSCDKTK